MLEAYRELAREYLAQLSQIPDFDPTIVTGISDRMRETRRVIRYVFREAPVQPPLTHHKHTPRV